MHAPSTVGAAPRVRLAFALTLAILVVEVAGGLYAGSLALLSDAGHVVTDLLVLGLSAFALVQVRRPGSARRSFGYHRVGILVALLNAAMLGAVVVAIVVSAIERLQHPAPVRGLLMLGAAVLALAGSLLVNRLLSAHAVDLTVRSVLVHVRGDALASAGVIVAAALIALTGRVAIDPILSLLIAGLVGWTAWQVLRSAVDILLESTPPDVDPVEVASVILRVPGVRDVHDLHIWSLAAERRAMSAHLLINDQPLAQAQQMLEELREILAHRFGVEHTTLQFEGVMCSEGDVFCVQPEGHPHLDEAHDRMRRALG
jgi:cobalt-zinc-cadmium efflux system protein